MQANSKVKATSSKSMQDSDGSVKGNSKSSKAKTSGADSASKPGKSRSTAVDHIPSFLVVADDGADMLPRGRPAKAADDATTTSSAAPVEMKTTSRPVVANESLFVTAKGSKSKSSPSSAEGVASSSSSTKGKSSSNKGDSFSRPTKIKSRKQVSEVDKELETAVSEHSKATKTMSHIEMLSYSKLSVGHILLGCVKSVDNLELGISLPDGLTGFVSMREVSDSMADLVDAFIAHGEQGKSDEDAPELPEMHNMFRVGDAVSVAVVKINANPTAVDKEHDATAKASRGRVELSMRASLINAGLAASDLRAGTMLVGAVQSVEDRGYIVDLGISGLNGFIPSTSSPASRTRRLVKGQPVRVVVNAAPVPGARSVIVSADPAVVTRAVLDLDSANKGKDEEESFSLEHLKPGTQIRAVVEKVLTDGIILRFFEFFFGSVTLAHLGHPVRVGVAWGANYAPGDVVRARVLFVNPITKTARLTLRPSLINALEGQRPLPQLSLGTIVEAARVIRLQKDAALIVDLSSVLSDEEQVAIVKATSEANAARRKAAAEAVADKKKQKQGKKAAESKAMADADSAASTTDATESAEIDMASNFAVETLASVSTGMIPLAHLSDEKLESIPARYKVGAPVRARVIGFNPMDGTTILSAKESVLERTVLHFEGLSVGLSVRGKILQHMPNGGLLVELARGLRGVVALQQLRNTPPSTLGKLAVKYAVDTVHTFRVLRLGDAENRFVHLTNKEALTRPDAVVVSSLDQAVQLLATHAAENKPLVAPGFVNKVTDRGVFVQFFGDAHGYVAVGDLVRSGKLVEGQNPVEAFTVGQAVTVAIRTADLEHHSLVLTFNLQAKPTVPGTAEEKKKSSAKAAEKAAAAVAPVSMGDVVQVYAKGMSDDGTHILVARVADDDEEEEEEQDEKEEETKKASFTYRVPIAHLSDHPAHAEALAKVYVSLGASHPLDALVLAVSGRNRTVTLSAKPLLVAAVKSGLTFEKDAAVVSSLSVGGSAVGYVSNVEASWVGVTLAGGVYCTASKSHLSDAFVTDPAQLFTPGQTVFVSIVSVSDNEEGTKRVAVSLKPSDVASASNANLAALDQLYSSTFFVEKALITKASEQVKGATELRKLCGEVKTAKITSSSKPEALFVTLDNVKAQHTGLAIRPYHVEGAAAESLAKGTTVQGRVLDVHEDTGIVDVTLRPSLVAASKAPAPAPAPAPVKGKSSKASKASATAAESYESKLAVGTSAPAVVELAHDDYCIVSLPSHGNLLAVAPVRSTNLSFATHSLFKAGFQCTVKVAFNPALASSSSASSTSSSSASASFDRIVVTLPLDQLIESRIKKGADSSRPPREPFYYDTALIGYLRRDQVLPVRVVELQGSYAVVRVGPDTSARANKYECRIHITNIMDAPTAYATAASTTSASSKAGKKSSKTAKASASASSEVIRTNAIERVKALIASGDLVPARIFHVARSDAAAKPALKRMKDGNNNDSDDDEDETTETKSSKSTTTSSSSSTSGEKQRVYMSLRKEDIAEVEAVEPGTTLPPRGVVTPAKGETIWAVVTQLHEHNGNISIHADVQAAVRIVVPASAVIAPSITAAGTEVKVADHVAVGDWIQIRVTKPATSEKNVIIGALIHPVLNPKGGVAEQTSTSSGSGDKKSGSMDDSHHHQEGVNTIDISEVKPGAVLRNTVRVIKVVRSQGFLNVRICKNAVGRVNLAEIVDGWVENPLEGFNVNDVAPVATILAETTPPTAADDGDSVRTFAVSFRASRAAAAESKSKAARAAFLQELKTGKSTTTSSSSSSSETSTDRDPLSFVEVLGRASLRQGDLVRCYVKAVDRKGVFFYLSGLVEGFSLMSNLDDEFVSDAAARFPVGKLVEARLLDPNASEGAVPLSLKKSVVSLKNATLLQSLKPGSIVKGTVSSVKDFGLFIKLKHSTLEGLAHVSECSNIKDIDLKAHFEVGDKVQALVLRINRQTNKLSLSLKTEKAAQVAAEAEAAAAAAAAASSEDGAVEGKKAATKAVKVKKTAASALPIDVEDVESSDDEMAEKVTIDRKRSEEAAAKRAVQETEKSKEESAKKRKEPVAKTIEEAAAAKPSLFSTIVADKKKGEETKTASTTTATATAAKSKTAATNTTATINGGLIGAGDDEDEGELLELSDDEDDSAASKKTKRQRREAKESENLAVELAERALMEDAKPQTSEDHERACVRTPNNSYVWVQYIAHEIKAGQVARARAIAERALKTINIRENAERWNIWCSLLSLECLYGNEESLDAVTARAQKVAEPVKVQLEVARIMEQAGRLESAVKHFTIASKRWGGVAGGDAALNIWSQWGEMYFKARDAEKAREVLANALKKLPAQDHVQAMVKFAQMEYAHTCGSQERGRLMLEKIVADDPSRLDIWSILVDKEVKAYKTLSATPGVRSTKTNAALKVIRGLFDRFSSSENWKRYTSKQMKFIFGKYIAFEEECGDADRVEKVQNKVRVYVASLADA